MNMHFSDQTRNNIFLIFLALVTTVTIISWPVAKEQNTLLLNDYKLYLMGNQLLNSNKHADAEPILAEMAKKYSNSYQMLWMYGLCLAENGKPEQGIKYMEQARKIRPALVTNQNYLFQYGEIQYRLGNYPVAERYLLESMKYNHDHEIQEKSMQLLERIKTSKK